MSSSSPLWGSTLYKASSTSERVSKGAVGLGTFFFEFACLVLVETAFSEPTFREVGALN